MKPIPKDELPINKMDTVNWPMVDESLKDEDKEEFK